MADEETKSAIATQLLNTLPNSQPDDSFYTLIVNGDNQGFDSETRYIPLDVVSSVSISASSDITTYPIINGDIISDHKYDQPKTVEISGTFALNGKWASKANTTFAFSGDKSSRLKNIEDYFFALRKYGKFISLVSSLNGGTRFTTLDNLAITSLRFTRNFNSMGFTINLKEIYTYENDNELDILENVSDPTLPCLGAFKSCDFAKDVLTYEGVDQMTIEALADAGLIAASFAEAFYDIVKNQAIATIGIAAAIIIFKILVYALAKFQIISTATAALLNAGGASLAIAGTIPVLGWVIIGVAALIAVGCVVFSLIKFIKRQSLISEFVAYDSEAENQNESDRFVKVLQTVRSSFNSLVKSNNIKFYNFTSNNSKQTTYLTIDDTIYQFYAEQIANGWSLKVTNASDNNSDVNTKNTSRLVGSGNLFGLKRSDAIFHTDNNTYVYILNKATVYDEYTDDDLKTMLVDAWKNGQLGYLGYTTEEMKAEPTDAIASELVTKFRNDGIYKDLTKFVFVVTNVKLDELEDALKDTISNCFKKEVYE